MEATHAFPLGDHWVYLILTSVFGVSVGITELVSRYKDEPVQAVCSMPGLLYCTINGAISAAAYFLLVYYKGEVFTKLGNDELMTAVAAGFGAMVVMRSKLFTFQSQSGEAQAIGPEAVLTTILSAVDRAIDRRRSERRQKAVEANLPEKLDRETAVQAIGFIRTSLASFQNLSLAERQAFSDTISKVESDTTLTPRLQLMALGYGLLNIGGEQNYKVLMKENFTSYAEKLAVTATSGTSDSALGTAASRGTAGPIGGSGASGPTP